MERVHTILIIHLAPQVVGPWLLIISSGWVTSDREEYLRSMSWLKAWKEKELKKKSLPEFQIPDNTNCYSVLSPGMRLKVSGLRWCTLIYSATVWLEQEMRHWTTLGGKNFIYQLLLFSFASKTLPKICRLCLAIFSGKCKIHCTLKSFLPS